MLRCLKEDTAAFKVLIEEGTDRLREFVPAYPSQGANVGYPSQGANVGYMLG